MNEDKATRYHRLKRRASLASLLWGCTLLGGLMWSGLSLALRGLAEEVASDVGAPAACLPAVAVAVYVLLLSVLNEIGSLPIAFYSEFLVERRYGLSTERLGGWLRDQTKAFAIGLVLFSIGTSVVYWLIRRSPEWWWLPAGLVFALLIVGLANLGPTVVLPLFYRVTPLNRESLRTRLLALADRAGVRALGAYEWGLGGKTRKANAALAGLGSTRRILVSDTMLAEYSEDEIEVVLAHEIAHHVHGDIWKGIVFESVLILGGLRLAARLLSALAPRVGLQSVGDIAGLPVLLIATGAAALVVVPIAHAMSRTFERNADRFALDLTRNPDAFVSAMRRLGEQNLAEQRPPRIVQWLFYSHPPVGERIADAQAFAGRRRSTFGA